MSPLARLAGDDALDDRVRPFHLLVPGDDLDPPLALLGRERGEVREHVQYRRRPEHRRDGLLHFPHRLQRLIVRAPRAPQVEGHAHGAVVVLLPLCGDREHVRDEQLRHVLLVVIVDVDCAVEPAFRRANRRLRLDHDQGQAVHNQNQIGTLLRLARSEGELLSDDVGVLLDVVESL